MTRASMGFFLISVMSLVGSRGLAQDSNSQDYNTKFSSYGQEVSAGCGIYLPSSVPGITEVMSFCGGRYGFKVGQQAVLETTLLDGNGKGQSYLLVSEDFRYDMPLDDLMASFYGGIDGHYSTSQTYDVNGNPTGPQSHLNLGFDAGTAIWISLSDAFYFRTDLKLLLTPGTSLFLGLSFVYRFDNSGGG